MEAPSLSCVSEAETWFDVNNIDEAKTLDFLKLSETQGKPLQTQSTGSSGQLVSGHRGPAGAGIVGEGARGGARPWGTHSLWLVRGLDHNGRDVSFKKTIMLNLKSQSLVKHTSIYFPPFCNFAFPIHIVRKMASPFCGQEKKGMPWEATSPRPYGGSLNRSPPLASGLALTQAPHHRYQLCYEARGLNPGHADPWGHLAMSGDISSCHTWGQRGSVLLASSVRRPGLLLHASQRTGCCATENAAAPRVNGAMTERLLHNLVFNNVKLLLIPCVSRTPMGPSLRPPFPWASASVSGKQEPGPRCCWLAE